MKINQVAKTKEQFKSTVINMTKYYKKLNIAITKKKKKLVTKCMNKYIKKTKNI